MEAFLTQSSSSIIILTVFMKNRKKLFNILFSCFLVVGVTALGLFVNSKIEADVIYPGYATVQVQLKTTAAQAKKFTAEVKILPTDGTKKFNFKKRSFSVKAGQTTINWTIKKVIPGTKNIVVSSPNGEFESVSATIALPSDAKTVAGPLAVSLQSTGYDGLQDSLNQALASPTPNASNSTTASVPVPPAPAAPTESTTSTASLNSSDSLSLPGGF